MKILTMATVLALGAVYMLGQVPEAQAQAWVPPYAWVVIGNGMTESTTSACVAASESHELRCCSDVELPGYQQKNDCSIWAESSLASAGGCVTAVTYEEALSTCNGDGGRLCSVAELESGCTAGTGCGYDNDLIRSSTPCTPDDVGFGGITIRPPSTWIPPYALVVRGNSQNAGIDGEISPSCVASSELHELRCCSDTELPGYQQKNGCDVWAESQFISVGEGGDGCVQGADYGEAQAVCFADGARMCSADELTNDCTAGTGCGHDTDLIRSSDSCSPQGTISGNIGRGPEYAWVSRGNPSNNGITGESATLCVAANSLHELRCCSDIELPGYQQRNGCDIWAESNFLSVDDGCVDGATYDEASAVCANDGARMCTLNEVQEGCTAGTGCGHDADLVRTSEPCFPDYAWIIIGSSGAIGREGGAACAATSEENEVRCCSDVELPGYVQNDGCTTWGESNLASVSENNGCVDDATFEQAHSLCAGDGARLCSAAELMDGCTAGTGCGHDADLIWTSSGCDPAQGIMGLGCQSESDMERFVSMVNAQCCAANECTGDSGLPSACNSACAEVLIPMQSACEHTGGYLSDPAMADLAASIDQAVQLCTGDGH